MTWYLSGMYVWTIISGHKPLGALDLRMKYEG
jgi:hypothetical protein